MHAFNSSTCEAKGGRSLSPRPGWSTGQVPGQSGLHGESRPKQDEEEDIKEEKKDERKINNFNYHCFQGTVYLEKLK